VKGWKEHKESHESTDVLLRQIDEGHGRRYQRMMSSFEYIGMKYELRCCLLIVVDDGRVQFLIVG
jgi:hypothetical protein